MSTQIDTYRCLIISPSDVAAERAAISAAISDWNAHIGFALNARVEAVGWETHAVSDVSRPPQEAINRQIVDGCDFGIAVFWSRIGSPTATARSGSIEEMDLLTRRGARVLAYQCNRDIPQNQLRDTQYVELQATLADLRKHGLLSEFASTESLKGMVILHMTNVVSGLAMTPTGVGNVRIGVVTAPTPDIRVVVTNATVYRNAPGEGVARPAESYLSITVQNHSPTTFFLHGVGLAVSDGSVLVPAGDALTGEYQKGARIESGDSFQLYAGLPELTRHLRKGRTMTHAYATDKIGRQFRGDETQLAKTLRLLGVT